MILGLLLAAAAPASAVEAERAFSDMAQTEGMWTAFRATADAEALMFVPGPVNAQQWLAGRKDPLVGYVWWPAKAYVSCDGSATVTSGPSVLGATRGYFTTVWWRRDGGWKWLLDHGDALAKAIPAGERPQVRTASCAPRVPHPGGTTLLSMEDRGNGKSADDSLRWTWQVFPDQSRRMVVQIWNGARYETVLEDEVAAP